MNLHSIVSGAIAAVNPFETVTLQSSIGYTTAADGSRLPTYQNRKVQAQVQGLAASDLKQIEGLNLQGVLNKVYFYGEVDGIVRRARKGGDLMTRADGSQWLTQAVLEQWPDWCAVVVVLQNNS